MSDNAEMIDRHVLLTAYPSTKKSDNGISMRISTISIISSRDPDVNLFVTFPLDTCQ